MSRRSDYDTPETPEATPPAIDPDARPRSARELEKDREKDGEAPPKRADPDARDEQLDDRLKTRQRREGMGEQAHDSAKPETLLPPD